MSLFPREDCLGAILPGGKTRQLRLKTLDRNNEENIAWEEEELPHDDRSPTNTFALFGSYLRETNLWYVWYNTTMDRGLPWRHNHDCGFKIFRERHLHTAWNTQKRSPMPPLVEWCPMKWHVPMIGSIPLTALQGTSKGKNRWGSSSKNECSCKNIAVPVDWFPTSRFREKQDMERLTIIPSNLWRRIEDFQYRPTHSSELPSCDISPKKKRGSTHSLSYICI